MRTFAIVVVILMVSACCRTPYPVSGPGLSAAGAPAPGSAGTIMLVHGAWGGPHDWKAVDRLLTAHGYEVYRPALTGQGERVHLAGPGNNLSTHVQDIVNVIEFEDLDNIILLGHSYGGMVITNVAHRIPGRIEKLVYVDACLPLDGESLFDANLMRRDQMRGQAEAQGGGWLLPVTWNVEKDVPHQIATFEEPSRLGNPEAEKIPAVYLLFAPDPATARFAQYAERARGRGWPVIEKPWGHNAHREIPAEFTDVLIETLSAAQ